MSNYLFAYGMFRDAARNLLGKPKHIGRKSVTGTMWRVDPFYPGVVLDNKNIVWGDLYEIDTKVLPELDEFEGEEYSRKIIKTQDGIECWIYEWILPTTSFKMIKSGDWLIR